jgi:cobalt-zinc-cadmium efflux system outer membrane protein
VKRRFSVRIIASLALPAVLTVICSPRCEAQGALSLRDAIDVALRSRASLDAEMELVSEAKGLQRQAELRPNPEFLFQNENLRPGQTYTRDVDTVTYVTQSLEVLGKRRERISVAQEGVSRAQTTYDVERVRIIELVKLAYWAARGADENCTALKAELDNFQKIVDYHSAQLSAGAISEQDLLRVQLESQRVKVSLNSATIDASRTRAVLMKAMGQTTISDARLSESLDPSVAIEALGVDRALARRLEIKVARAALEEARAKARVEEVAARPDLSVFAGYKRTQLPDTVTGVNTAIAGVQLTLPLANKNQGNRLAAEAEVRRQELLVAAAENAVRADYAGALREYEMRRAQFAETLFPLRDSAAKISQIAAQAYAAGGTDLLRLLDAERARLDAELTFAQRCAEYHQSIARLEAAEGVNQ